MTRHADDIDPDPIDLNPAALACERDVKRQTNS